MLEKKFHFQLCVVPFEPNQNSLLLKDNHKNLNPPKSKETNLSLARLALATDANCNGAFYFGQKHSLFPGNHRNCTTHREEPNKLSGVQPTLTYPLYRISAKRNSQENK